MGADERFQMREVVIPEGESLAMPAVGEEDPLVGAAFQAQADGSYDLFALRYTGSGADDAVVESRRYLGTLRLARGELQVKWQADKRLTAILSALFGLWLVFWLYRVAQGWRF